MYKFKFADIGEGLHEGVVAEIYKKEGDKVNEGDSLFSVETDKVTSDIPSPTSGVISKVLMAIGDTIHVGDEVYYIDDGSGDSAPVEETKNDEKEDSDEGAASVVGDIKVSNKLFSFDMFAKKGASNKKQETKVQSNHENFNLESINPTGNGEKVDVVIIGGGPAGYKAAAELGKNGLKVVNIEKTAFGGTCVNIGCIPVKTLIESSKVVRAIKEAKKYAIEIDASKLKLDAEALNKRRWEVSKSLSTGAEMVVKGAKALAVKGEAVVIDKHNVKVGDKTYTTKVIMIATGAKPEVIDLPGFAEGYKAGKIVDSTIALDLKAYPSSVTVIGGLDHGGPTIDINFAQILSDLGIKVTLIKQAPAVANLFDSSMQKIALESLKKVGVEVVLNAKVKEFKNDTVVYLVDGKEMKVKSDVVLAATGRDYLETGIEKVLNLEMNDNGFIKVDENFRTNVDNVFAMGDAIGEWMLAHEGFRHGVVVANYILGTPMSYKHHLVPRTSYVVPEMAGVGYTEEQLKEMKMDYIKAEWAQKFNGKSVADGHTDGLTKILIGKKHGEILGVFAASSTAIDSIGEATALMELEATIEEMFNTTHAHPATSETLFDVATLARDLWKKANK
ncbi:MAG: FAD-dependent oxidoreductase [Mycoplasmatales bacterium]|nr:FAD-dependent oxidoreductase [Mycoplasmatales bacterium]